MGLSAVSAGRAVDAVAASNASAGRTTMLIVFTIQGLFGLGDVQRVMLGLSHATRRRTNGHDRGLHVSFCGLWRRVDFLVRGVYAPLPRSGTRPSIYAGWRVDAPRQLSAEAHVSRVYAAPAEAGEEPGKQTVCLSWPCAERTCVRARLGNLRKVAGLPSWQEIHNVSHAPRKADGL